MDLNSLVIFTEPTHRPSSYYHSSIAGIEHSASKRGIAVLPLSSPADLKGQMPRTAMLICAGLTWTGEMVCWLRRLGVKSLIIGAPPSFFGEDVSGVDVNRKKLLDDTVHYLFRAGRRRLASVGHERGNANDQMRERYFLQAMHELSGVDASRDIYYLENSLEQSIRVFLDHAHQYDAAVCVNDAVGVQLTVSAHQRGLKLPEDLYIIGSGNFHIAKLVRPALTTTTLDYRQMGKLAFDIWNAMERNPAIDSQTISITGSLICRDSTALFPVDSLDMNPLDSIALQEGIQEMGTLQLEMLENCLRQLDELDCQIIHELLLGTSIEQIAEKLFVSAGTINYRLKKLYATTNVPSRRAFMELISTYIEKPEDIFLFST